MRLHQRILAGVVAELLFFAPLTVHVALAADPSPSPSPSASTCTSAPPDISGEGNAAQLLADPPDSSIPDDTPDSTSVEGAPDPSASPSSSPSTSPQALAPDSTALADVAPPTDPTDTTDYGDPGEGNAPLYQSFDLNQLKKNPLFDQSDFDGFVAENRGWQDANGRWDFCTALDMTDLNSIAPIGPDVATYVNTLLDPTNKIDFENPLDRVIGLTGEPCTLFDPKTQACDETKTTTTTPVLDAQGNPVLDKNGQPVTTTATAPKYYTDVNNNGAWDAPKADVRILKTLDYLITPTARGGAGREHIKVAKILQFSSKDTEFTTSDSTSGSTTTTGTGTATASASASSTPSEANDDGQATAHAYDTNPADAAHPQLISQALDISEIDDVRITTKIVQEHRLGGNTTTYQYTKVPIQVSWQTDQGAATAPLVGPSLYQSALSSFTMDLGSLLDSMGLSATFDLSSINDVKSLGDVADLIGKSLLSQILNTPGGSLSGYDFPSVLDTLGREYLASQLGLPGNAFSTGTTADDLLQSVGRSTIEKAFNFPPNSLVGTSSVDIIANLGRREIETTLGVSDGTLLPLGVITQTDLLERLGAGRIEQRFSLNPGSMREASLNKVLQIPKVKLMFNANSATFMDEALSLAYQDNGTGGSTYGFSSSDYNQPTLNLVKNQSDAAWAKYKEMVGARVIESGLGTLSSTTSSLGTTNTNPELQDFVTTVKNTFGFNLYPTQGGKQPPSTDVVVLDATRTSVPGFVGRVTMAPDNPILTSGAFSSDDLRQLAIQMLTDDSKNTYGNLCLHAGSLCQIGTGTNTATSIAGATALYNSILTNWKGPLEKALSTLETNLTVISQGQSDVITTSDQTAARQTISTALGQVRSYADGLLTSITADGQSGRSAGLGLPGSFMQTNPDGTLTGTTLYTGGDPVNALLSGNLSSDLMGLIGKSFAARSMTTDNPAILTFISQLKTTLQNYDSLTQFGIGTDAWTSNGFSKDDFDRIFTKDLASDVFRRVGQQQLLGTLWNRTDLQTSVNSAFNSANGAAGSILNQANQVVETLTFYTTRFQEVQTLGKQILSQVNSDASLTSDQKQSFSDLLNFSDASSIQTVIDKSRDFEPIFNVVGTDVKGLATLVSQAEGLLQEIAAGHSLSLNQSPNGTPPAPNGVSRDGCFVPSQLQSFFKTPTNLVTSLASQVASCRIDDSLSLPLGSTYLWYQSKDYSLDSLTLSIGQAFAKDTNAQLSDDAARAYGQKYLESVALDKLLSGIPGLSSTFKKLGFQATDIVALLSGQGEQVLRKMGGSMMDSYFNWTPGTAANIILPQCYNPDHTVRACTPDEATNIRLSAMAQMGLKELGITLSFPSSFNIVQDPNSPLAQFDLPTNFGIARISQTLGLATNSFYGTFSDVRGRNTPAQMLQALGWYATPISRNLDALATNLNNAKGSIGDVSEAAIIDNFVSTVKSKADAIRNSVLDEVSNPDSDVWVDGDEATVGAKLYTNDLSSYTDLLNNLRDTVANYPLSDSALTAVQSAIAVATSATTGNATTYANQIRAFKVRTQGMDGQLGLSKGDFQAFITGTGRGEDIAGKEGKQELVSTLADKALTAALDGTPFALLPATFKTLTKTTQCPNGVDLGNFLVNLSGNTDPACTLGSVSLSSILTGTDSNDVNKRAFLYDNFLARTWGMQIEKDLQVQPGTLRAIALQPSRAGEIAVDQGIRLVGTELFKLANLGGSDTDENKQLLRSFHSSLMAGFCPVDPSTAQGSTEQALTTSTNQLCAFQFNAQRSFTVLKQDINQMLQARYNQDGTDSTKIGLLDVAAVFIGGMNAAYFIGAMDLAQQLNSQLVGNDPNAQKFKINYNDIRNAFGQYTLTQADYNVIGQKAEVTFVRGYYQCTSSSADPACKLSDNAILTTYLAGSDGVMSNGDRAETIQEVHDQAILSAPSMMRAKALTSLQYNLYDIAAFHIDKDIPRGFSQAMLAGTPQEKFRYLGLYLANKLNIGQSVFGGLLSNQQVVDLVQYVAGGFKGPISLDAVTSLDNWLTKESKSLFGVSLPTGTVEGLFAWGSTGFKGSTFDTTAKYNVGGKLFSPLGTVLKQWGENQILTWADKTLGFKAGSALQIYQAAADVARASTFLALAETPASKAKDVVQTLVNQISGSGKVVDSQAVARANLRAAQAALAAVVINIVFSKQIGALEQGLGLVPGTGALAVTMLVDLAMGVPISPITLALFVGINLFGTYKVEISIQATPDGYYPFTGIYGSARYSPEEELSPDPPSGEFDAKNPVTYRAGVEAAARYKVYNLLRDLLLMPDRWAPATGDDPATLRVSQIYTGRVEDAAAVEDLAARPFPYGFGEQDAGRATYQTDPNTGNFEAVPNPSFRSGVFADSAFDGFIHIRW